jgi:hypothetical protein
MSSDCLVHWLHVGAALPKVKYFELVCRDLSNCSFFVAFLNFLDESFRLELPVF